MPTYRVIQVTFDRLLPFFLSRVDPPPTVKSLISLLEFKATRDEIKIQLATAVKIGGELEKITTQLEGDQVLIFTAWPLITQMQSLLGSPLPNEIRDLIRSIYPPEDVSSKIARCESMYAPCHTYLQGQLRKFSLSFHVLRLATLWHPVLAASMTDSSIREVRLPYCHIFYF